MRYRVLIRGQKGDFEREVQCDGVDFENSWWAKFYRLDAAPLGLGFSKITLLAIPSEHLNLIELLEAQGLDAGGLRQRASRTYPLPR